MNKKITGSIIILLLLVVWGSSYLKSPFYSESSDGVSIPATENSESILDLDTVSAEGRPVKTVNLTAEKTTWKLSDTKSVEAWTYNGTVPGETIRVTEGDFLQVNLTNELEVPVSIHWHGVVLPNRMDGVPGLTQDAVQPGETFTYEFVANNPGTYWYHSHQNSADQVDMGLYAPLIIEEDDEQYEQDEVFIIDEWAVNQNKWDMSNMMGGMMNDGIAGNGEGDTIQMYDTFSVNGKSGTSIESLVMEKGKTARLRFINAGYQQHQLVFPKGSMEVIANDAEDVIGSRGDSNILEIAPGERIDVAFTKQSSDMEVIGENPQVEHAVEMIIPVVTKKQDDIGSERLLVSVGTDTVADGTSYGSAKLIFEDEPKVDVSYEMNLSMGMNMGQGMGFQINGETFPDTPPIKVSKGDIVKVTMTNNGRMNHPMHLHGHKFQVAEKNDSALKSPVVKDIIHVKPGESFTIYFKADNKGQWLFHCHDNNHAEMGMVTIVDYNNVYSPFQQQ